MAFSNLNPFRAVGKNRIVVAGSFRPNGGAGIVAGSTKGKGFSVAYSSTGLYLVTFADKVNDFDSCLTGLRCATATPTMVQAGDYDASAKTLQLRVLQAATGAVTEPTGIIPLPLGAFQEQDGTTLADFADGASPTPGWSAGDESGGIRWNNHANPDPVSTQFVWPADVDITANATLHILAAKVGATLADAVTWKVEVFNNIAAALYDADADYGGTSSAMTGDAATKTVQDETLTLALADLPAAVPAISTLTIQPTDGTLGTDDVILLGAWIAYTKTDWATTGQVWNLTDLAADVDNVVNFSAIFRNSSRNA